MSDWHEDQEAMITENVLDNEDTVCMQRKRHEVCRCGSRIPFLRSGNTIMHAVLAIKGNKILIHACSFRESSCFVSSDRTQ